MLQRHLLLFAISMALSLGVAVGVPVGSHDTPDTVISHIPRERVASNAIASVGYSKRQQILEIEFLNGAIYRYVGVPRSVHLGLMSAESKAHFYYDNIRGNYPSFRIRKWQTRQTNR